nr:MAG TPA: hypothetical protein [Bacteriophage sp.]
MEKKNGFPTRFPTPSPQTCQQLHNHVSYPQAPPYDDEVGLSTYLHDL